MDWLTVLVTVVVVVALFVGLAALGRKERRRFDALTPEQQQEELAKRQALKAERQAKKELRSALQAENTQERQAQQELRSAHRAENKLEQEARQAEKRRERELDRERATKEREYREAERAARKPLVERLKAAEKDYARRVRDAENNFSKKKIEADQRLRAAQNDVAQAEAMGRNRVAKFRGRDGSVEAFENVLVVGDKTFQMETSVRATVDASGNFFRHSRSTLTRMAAGGMLFGPVGVLAGGMVKKAKTHDTRELYLLIEGDEFAAVITCDPNYGPSAQHAAAAINQAAKTSNGLEERRAAGIASALERLEAAKTTHEMDYGRARNDLDDIRGQRHRLAEAQEDLDRFDTEWKSGKGAEGGARTDSTEMKP